MGLKKLQHTASFKVYRLTCSVLVWIVLGIFLAVVVNTEALGQALVAPDPASLLLQARDDLQQSAQNQQASKDAVDALNMVLLQPAGLHTEEAQRLIGFALERAGQLERAKAEYQAYLQLYPDSAAAPALRNRLLALEIAAPVKTAAARNKAPAEGSERKQSASLSEYLIASGSSSLNQALLVSNLQANAFLREGPYQLKAVFRESKVTNFLQSGQGKTNFSTGYVDYSDTFVNYGVRVGRQTSPYGVLGRFDGAALRMLQDDWSHYDLVVGVPYTGPSQTQRHFTSLAYGSPLASSWNWTAYVNEQRADSMIERRAVGGDVRYLDDTSNAVVLVDYDEAYKALNWLTVQGSTLLGTSTVSFILDRRRSPVLYADKALAIGLLKAPDALPYTSVSELVRQSGLTHDGILNYVSRTTPVAVTVVLGVSHPVTPRWSVYADVQSSNVVQAPPPVLVPGLEPEPVAVGSGATYALSTQLVGTKVFGRAGNVTAMLNRGLDRASRSGYATLMASEAFSDARIDLTARYDFRSQGPLLTSNWMFSSRLSYHVTPTASLESQLSYSLSNMQDLLLNKSLNTNTTTFYLGGRFEL